MSPQNAHAEERKQGGERQIGNTLSRALIVSLLLHLLLLAWLRLPVANETGDQQRLRVRLQRPLPPPPRTVPPPPSTVTAPRPPATQPAVSEPAVTTNPATDWYAEARAVTRASPHFNPFAPAAADGPNLDAPPPGRLARAFKPAPRPLELCGRMATLVLGERRIDIPISYLCEDKNVEYRTAPGAGRLIGEPEIDDPAQR